MNLPSRRNTVVRDDAPVRCCVENDRFLNRVYHVMAVRVVSDTMKHDLEAITTMDC